VTIWNERINESNAGNLAEILFSNFAAESRLAMHSL